MEQCIALGKKAMSEGNPPVGALIVKNEQIIGIGIEAGKSSKNITKHAEIEAVNDVIHNTKLQNLEGCKLYTSHEPCIMCSYVLRHYKIETIVYGSNVDFVGGITSEFKVLMTANIPKWGNSPKIISGVLQEKCDHLTTDYKMNLKNSKDEK
jgi:tRNA(adenine34) deaminase